MKKTSYRIIIISIVLAIIVSFANVFAFSVESEEEEFFSVNTEEIAVGDVLEMTINLDSIDYESFVFTLSSDTSVGSAEVVETVLENVVENTNTGIIMEIDKEKIDLDVITLYYEIPDTLAVGDTIEFTATITSLESDSTDENTVSNNIIVENTTTNTLVDTEDSSDLSEEVTIQVKIIELNEDENTIDSNSVVTNNVQEANVQNSNEISFDMSTLSYSSAQTTSSSASEYASFASTALSTSSITSSSQTETVTYNGSDNNYLSELYIDGYEFSKEYSKENTTYFISVDSDVEELDVTATADDENATVCIYGNDTLTTGTNKILVTVTAENGNVRVYRIIVNKA